MTKNMTVGNPAKLILFFTIPLLIGNLFQQLYNMADTLIVGRTIGVDALAAVGCTSSIMFLILGFTQGLTAGLSIVTAQRFGAGDEEGVRRSFAAGILIGGVITVFLTALSVALARPILILMRTLPTSSTARTAILSSFTPALRRPSSLICFQACCARSATAAPP